MNIDFYTLEEVSEICDLEMRFIRELACFGIIEVQIKENNECVLLNTLETLKMIKRLYFDLGVNKEGIEIILSMRNQIRELQKEVKDIRNTLKCMHNEQHYRNIETILEKGLLFDI